MFLFLYNMVYILGFHDELIALFALNIFNSQDLQKYKFIIHNVLNRNWNQN